MCLQQILHRPLLHQAVLGSLWSVVSPALSDASFAFGRGENLIGKLEMKQIKKRVAVCIDDQSNLSETNTRIGSMK